jgi:hypothetical protein
MTQQIDQDALFITKGAVEEVGSCRLAQGCTLTPSPWPMKYLLPLPCLMSCNSYSDRVRQVESERQNLDEVLHQENINLLENSFFPLKHLKMGFKGN